MASFSKARHPWALWLLADLFFFAIFAFLAWRYFPSRAQTADQLDAALKMLHGQLPYINLPAEYPPLTYLFYLLPALFFRAPVSYFAAYVVEFMLFDMLAIWLIAKISARLGISVTRSLIIHAVLIVAVGPILVASYDVIPAVLTLVALYFFIKEKSNWAWAFAGLGFMTKIFPAVLVPVFVLYLWRQKKYQQILLGAVIFIGIALALSLPWLVLNAKAYSVVATYELERPLHSESLYGSVLLVGKILGFVKVSGVYDYGSWNLTSLLADRLATLSSYITLTLLALAYFLYFRTLHRGKFEVNALSSLEVLNLTRYAAASVLVLIVFGKVLSIQYLVWLVPLLPLIKGRWQLPVYAAFVVAGIFSQFIYPYNYNQFENYVPSLVVMMLARNLLLIACAIFLLSPDNRREAEPGY